MNNLQKPPMYVVICIATTISLMVNGCDDPNPKPGSVGGLVLAIRSFQATSDPNIMAVRSFGIVTSRVEVAYSKTLNGDAQFLTVDSKPRMIEVVNNQQTDLLVAQYQVPPGYVSQIRIFPSSVTIHLKNGNDIPLKLPGPNLPS